MKKLCCLFLCILLIGCGHNKSEPARPDRDPTPSKDITASLQSFSNKTLPYMLHGDENIAYSPLSLYIVLSMNAADSRDETLEQLLLGLSYGNNKSTLVSDTHTLMTKLQNNEAMKSANSVWINEHVQLDLDYQDILSNKYFSSIQNVDFTKQKDVKRIENWIYEHTDKLLKPTLNYGKNTMMSIINTLVIKNQWTHPFDKSDTKTEPFYQKNAQIKADFMCTNDQQAHLEHDTYDYGYLSLKENMRMYFFLPKEGYDLTTIWNNDWLQDINYEGDNIRDIEFAIPKFSYDSSLKAKEPLQDIGITKIFQKDAQFSSTSTSGPLYISNILHNTHIEIDEYGIKAAAITLEVMESAAPTKKEPLDLTLNRPFFYVITSENLPLFTGIVNQPTKH